MKKFAMLSLALACLAGVVSVQSDIDSQKQMSEAYPATEY